MSSAGSVEKTVHVGEQKVMKVSVWFTEMEVSKSTIK